MRLLTERLHTTLCVSISNEERSAALAIGVKILLAVVETNKWQHIIQDSGWHSSASLMRSKVKP
ncbi:hypothetical protein N7472_003364 [Penicillium cf. griseofulvum]|uniref:Uncharacterized protein n=1 Tax=Penicillium cf. griseofulvum TaxID=2972120 RepID=A0A9W9T2J1_9EURO|nr:hypothetical protein N7472_003364 [Penicillium cf. griseofulvum]